MKKSEFKKMVTPEDYLNCFNPDESNKNDFYYLSVSDVSKMLGTQESNTMRNLLALKRQGKLKSAQSNRSRKVYYYLPKENGGR